MRAITIDADTGKRIYTRKEVADLVGACLLYTSPSPRDA